MRLFRRKPQGAPTLEALSLAQDDVVRMFARTIASLQVRAESTEGTMRNVVGRIDQLEGHDNSTEGSPRTMSFATINRRLDALERTREEAASG